LLSMCLLLFLNRKTEKPGKDGGGGSGGALGGSRAFVLCALQITRLMAERFPRAALLLLFAALPIFKACLGVCFVLGGHITAPESTSISCVRWDLRLAPRRAALGTTQAESSRAKPSQAKPSRIITAGAVLHTAFCLLFPNGRIGRLFGVLSVWAFCYS
jgi:hypothetical protein